MAQHCFGVSRPNRLTSKTLGTMALLASLSGLFISTAYAQNENTLNRLMQVKPESAKTRLSPVREAALRSAATTLGTQTGLIERAREINKEVEARRAKLEKSYRFGDLVIGAGVLPPVLVVTENAASVTNDSMRLAGSIYQIRQPARFFSGAPSWRDWLLMGLPVDDKMPDPPKEEQLLPRNAEERAFWEQQIKEAYLSGREQAQEIFDNNLGQLEEVYLGMRTFYELYQRQMVSAPIIAKSQEIVTQDDKNTIVVGDTLFRITAPSEFKVDPKKWRALEAKPPMPATEVPLLAADGSYDRAQVAAAMDIHNQQQARKEAIARAKAMGVKDVDLNSGAQGSSGSESSGATSIGVTSNSPAEPAQALPVEPSGRTIHMRIGEDLKLIETSSGSTPNAPAGAQVFASAPPAKPLFTEPTN